MKKTLLLSTFFFVAIFFAQEKTKAEKLLVEIQQVKQVNKNIKMVWWMPTEYWRAATINTKQITEQQLQTLENMLDDYTIIAAGDYNLGSEINGVDFNSLPISNKFELYDLKGKKIPVLKNAEIDEKVSLLIDRFLKPLFGKMLGKMGTGIEFFIFSNKDSAGNKIIDPTKEGGFKVVLSGQSFTYKLPLVSLMPEKTCPIDQQKFPGNYIYCPIHGNKF